MNAAMVMEDYRDQFAAREEVLPGFGLPWLRQDREQAMARFMASGFPSQRMEAWKYTAIPGLASQPMALSDPTCLGLAPDDLDDLLLDRRRRAHLVFVNGIFSRALSDLAGLPAGVRVGSLSAFLAEAPAEVPGAWVVDEEFRTDRGLAELNRALWRDGAFLAIGPGVRVEGPIQLLYLNTVSGEPLLVNARNLLVVGQGASARVVESHFSLGASRQFTNVWTTLALEREAELHHLMLMDAGDQAQHVGTLRATLAGGSSLESGLFAFSGRLTRQELEVDLAEEGAQCHMTGLFTANGHQHVDFHVVVKHGASATTSRQEFKGILDDHARGVFDGVVRVPPGVGEIVSSQTTHNLLLSPTAEIDAKPQLEIHAHAVQCTHGATVGSLDEDALFYLRSRGVEVETARNLLADAFAGEILERVAPEALRDWLIRHYESCRSLP